VQVAVGDEAVHDLGVGDRDDRVVVPRQDQRGRPQPGQKRQAGPGRARQQLVVVPPGRAEAGGGVQQVAGHDRIFPGAAAVELAGDAGRVVRVPVPSR
jgi:hypothetical protein